MSEPTKNWADAQCPHCAAAILHVTPALEFVFRCGSKVNPFGETRSDECRRRTDFLPQHH